jgi:hypothetical protein
MGTTILEEPASFSRVDDGGSRFLQNTGDVQPDYRVSSQKTVMLLSTAVITLNLTSHVCNFDVRKIKYIHAKFLIL